jgi:hypothetical protein
MSTQPEKQPLQRNPLPIAAPTREGSRSPTGADGPDLHIEEIEEKQIPKDRNIFDK